MKASYDEIARAIATKNEGMTLKQADSLVRDVVDVMSDKIAYGEGISFKGLFSIEPRMVAEKTGMNPKTKGTVIIPRHLTAKFKLGSVLKDKMQATLK